MATPVAMLRGTTAPNGVVYQATCPRPEDAPKMLEAWKAIRLPVGAFVKLEHVLVDQEVNEDKAAPVGLDPKTGHRLAAAPAEGDK